ncbi:hypothetical protein [Nocardia lasii]|uniref:Uncharacterized protein n=1 Tax=Nocardia lasii TaxID=1616107 RepID=A0ABW1JXE6_9NOCA
MRRLESDGVSVELRTGPLLSTHDPHAMPPSYFLKVIIDGWGGELAFKRGSDEAAESGAETLVRLVRAMKG